jgi:hypothetical protein
MHQLPAERVDLPDVLTRWLADGRTHLSWPLAIPRLPLIVVLLTVLTPAGAFADEDSLAALANDTGRLEVSAGPALRVDGSFATAKWGVQVSLGKPLWYGSLGPLREALDGMVTATFARGSDALVTAGGVADTEVWIGRRLGFDLGIGLGFGATLGNQSHLGGHAVVETGMFLAPFDDPRRRFKLQVRDVTALLSVPAGTLQTPLVLSLAIGFETAF